MSRTSVRFACVYSSRRTARNCRKSRGLVIVQPTLLDEWQLELLLYHLQTTGCGLSYLFGGQQINADVVDCFVQCVSKLIKVLFVQEDFMLLVFFFADTLALSDGDVEIFF